MITESHIVYCARSHQTKSWLYGTYFASGNESDAPEEAEMGSTEIHLSDLFGVQLRIRIYATASTMLLASVLRQSPRYDWSHPCPSGTRVHRNRDIALWCLPCPVFCYYLCPHFQAWPYSSFSHLNSTVQSNMAGGCDNANLCSLRRTWCALWRLSNNFNIIFPSALDRKHSQCVRCIHLQGWRSWNTTCHFQLGWPQGYP